MGDLQSLEACVSCRATTTVSFFCAGITALLAIISENQILQRYTRIVSTSTLMKYLEV